MGHLLKSFMLICTSFIILRCMRPRMLKETSCQSISYNLIWQVLNSLVLGQSSSLRVMGLHNLQIELINILQIAKSSTLQTIKRTIKLLTLILNHCHLIGQFNVERLTIRWLQVLALQDLILHSQRQAHTVLQLINHVRISSLRIVLFTQIILPKVKSIFQLSTL
jgi:hypothetical protein